MEALAEFKSYLKKILESKSSDLHISVGAPVQMRVDGSLQPMSEEVLDSEKAKALCYAMLTPAQIEQFEKEREIDLAIYFEEEKSRFRVNLFFQMGTVSGAYRPIATDIPSPDQLGVPAAALNLINCPRGLVLVTGPTGSGKSTTLASMINQINTSRHEHIITIEDPIEYVHQSKNSLVVQRELGSDTMSFAGALKRVLRQDPDIVLIGEMRDIETIGTAITVSETGHLVFATLHTNTAAQTINRIIDVFPPHQQPQIRTQLSFILEGVLCQQLVPKIGGGRVLAMEIMIPTHAIRNLIREDKVHQMQSLMQMGQDKSGMITMNQCLFKYYKEGLIAKDDALDFSTDLDDMKKMLAC